MRVGIGGGQDEPDILHIRCEQGSLLAHLPSGSPVAAAQCLTSFDDEFTSFDELRIHGITFNNENEFLFTPRFVQGQKT